MISLTDLAGLATGFSTDLPATVVPLRIGGQTFATDDQPLVMGCLNLSGDSTYRESIARTTESAIRRGRAMQAQGATIVDLGAESTTAAAARVGPAGQSALLVPVIRGLCEAGVIVSAESYQPEVVQDCLAAGAQVINYTGADGEEQIFDLVAEHEATIVLCYTRGANVRDAGNMVVSSDPLPQLLEYFGARIARARARGAERIVIDPGMGFYYTNLTDPQQRIAHQTQVLLNSFRLRVLGLPVCNALPHAATLFEDQMRMAEGFFAVLASLGRTDVFRTHEVPHVAAVLTAMRALSV